MQFLLTLPESLVRELFHEARAQTLACHPFFLEIGAANPTMELQLCNKAASELYLLEHDVIFHGKQKGQGMYVLASGGAKYSQGTEFYHAESCWWSGSSGKDVCIAIVVASNWPSTVKPQ
ncbi:Wrn [Symbiodinium pilosum]|uniref:Wrn protein n=1 Tax=Symbiodinium pilosum TaxID=2952 RepID=A0A812XSC6_SYMPI|nr:Wrn [Symbiodinium pilosum]